MMMAENAGGVRRSLAHDESAREKQTPLTLRNEAQLNCVSLRPEFDCEVTWGAVKGQDERPLRGALDSSPSHHRRFGKELIKDGRHVGLDFLRPSHRSIQTTRPESSGSEGRDTTAGMEGQPRKCWASLRSVCRTKVAEESCGHPSCFLGQCDLPGGGPGLWNWLGVLPYYNDSSVTAPPAAALHLVEIAIGRFQ